MASCGSGACTVQQKPSVITENSFARRRSWVGFKHRKLIINSEELRTDLTYLGVWGCYCCFCVGLCFYFASWSGSATWSGEATQASLEIVGTFLSVSSTQITGLCHSAWCSRQVGPPHEKAVDGGDAQLSELRSRRGRVQTGGRGSLEKGISQQL